MANTRAQQLALVNANLPNNTTKQITPVKHRQVESESITASAFIDDANTFNAVNTFNDNSIFNGVNDHTKEVRWHKGVSLASASNIDLGNTGNFHHVTGAVEIQTLSTKQHGTRMLLYFASTPNLKHSANLILPGAVDLQTTAGALAEFISEGGGVWRLNSYAGRLPVGMGGTGQTSYTNGQLLIGNTATGGLSKATLTAGSNITITNGNGTITIAATGGGGGGVTTVGAFSASSQTNGASIAGSTITFGPADGTNPGMVTTGFQTIAGQKTFTGLAAFNSSPAVTSCVTINPTTGSLANAQLTITGSTIQWISLGGGTQALPSPTSRSGGTKIVLWDVKVVDPNLFDYALGVAPGLIAWISSPGSVQFFTNNGSTVRATIDGDANNSNLTLTSATNVSLIAATATTANVFNTVATTVNVAGAATTLTIGATTGTMTLRNPTINLSNASGIIQINGIQVVRARITGWGATTGTISRAAFTATASATYVQAELTDTIQALKAVITDLRTHGLINN